MRLNRPTAALGVLGIHDEWLDDVTRARAKGLRWMGGGGTCVFLCVSL